MQERIKPTRSGLFAIELLISVGVFSLCAAICVGLFVRSEVMSQDSANLNQAVTVAKNAAECFKAAGGDMAKTAQLTGGKLAGNTLFLEYDEHWNMLDPGTAGTFELILSASAKSGYTGASVSVKRFDARDGIAGGVELLSWDIAALEVAS